MEAPRSHIDARSRTYGEPPRAAAADDVVTELRVAVGENVEADPVLVIVESDAGEGES